MGLDMIERNWKPFKSKVELLLNNLSDAHLSALFSRRVDGSTNDRIGQQVEGYGQQIKG